MVIWILLNSAVLGLLTFILLYLVKVKNAYNHFKKLGIKTPKYEFFYGNYRELAKETFSCALQKWTKLLGTKTYGYYEGHCPILVTSDLEMVQEILVKQYANFSARKKYPLNGRDESQQINLFFATKSKWKRMRVIMNPTFSSAKLRELSPFIIKCVDRLVDVVQKDGNEINVANYFKRFTMDTIWNCAFGVDIDVQKKDSESDYFIKCEKAFSDSWKFTFPMYIGLYFFEFKDIMIDSLVLFFKVFGNFFKNVPPVLWLREKISELVEKKTNEKSFRKDYIQLLLDAKIGDSEKNEFDDDSIELTSMNLNKKLTIYEVKNNLVLFMLAGYETTSTTLTYCTYILATHLEEQQKLFEEITSLYNENNEAPDYDNVNKLEYLDMFIKEVLRYYPLGPLTRRCTNPVTIKGINIPLNQGIAIDVLSIHFDAEIWGPIDPKVFYPLRFSPEIKRNQMAFLSFGVGPRYCIGMKFALLELKLALVKMISNYEIRPSKNTPEYLTFNEGIVRIPREDINVLIKKRDSTQV